MLRRTHTHLFRSNIRNSFYRISSLLQSASSKIFTRCAVVALLIATPASVNAQAIFTELNAMKSVMETTADGLQIEKLVPVATILPGEKVIYTLNYGNQSDTPVTGVVISLPMPKEMTFVPGSADQSGTSVTYTVDGGKTYDQLERLTITTADGLERPARADDITAIRWTVLDALEPAQSGAVRCTATVN